MSKVGEYITMMRKAQNLTIGDISDKTAIRTYIVELLEAGDFNALPSYVHAHGFLVQYTKVLGLNFEKDVKPLFDKECRKATFGMPFEEIPPEEEDTAVEETVQKVKPVKPAKPKRAKPIETQVMEFVADKIDTLGTFFSQNASNKVVVVSLIVIVLALGIFFMFKNVGMDSDTSSSRGVYTPPIATVMPGSDYSVTEVVERNSVQSAPTTPIDKPAVVPSKVSVTLTYSDKCWTRYNSDDGTQEEFIADVGIVKVITFNKYFMINVGNAAAVSVKYGNEVFDNLGGANQPISNLYFIANPDGTMTRSRTLPN